MSITVLPYLDQNLLNQTSPSTTNAKTADTVSDNSSDVSFSTSLDTAKKAVKLMAIDTAIAQAKASGSNGISMNSELAVKLGISNYISTSTTATGLNTTVKHTPVSQENTFSKTELTCSEELNPYFVEAAETYNVDINLLKSIAKAESNFRPDATSSAGAMGVMQLMPATAADLGVTNAYDAHENIMGGAKLISQLLTKYDNNLSLALAAYNAGSGNVDKYGGIPPFKETQNYVTKVLEYYN